MNNEEIKLLKDLSSICCSNFNIDSNKEKTNLAFIKFCLQQDIVDDNLKETILDKLWHKLGKNFVSRNVKFSEKLLSKYIGSVGMLNLYPVLCLNKKNISEDFIEKNIRNGNINDHCLSGLAYSYKFSEEFIERNIKFFEYNSNFWCHISKCGYLSENFIDNHYNLLNWENISYYQKLSNNVITKYRNKLSPIIVLTNNNTELEDPIQYLYNSLDLIKEPEEPKLLKSPRNFRIERMNADFRDMLENTKYMSVKFMTFLENSKEFKDKIDWERATMNKYIDDEFVEKYSDKIKWGFFLPKRHKKVSKKIKIKYKLLGYIK